MAWTAAVVPNVLAGDPAVDLAAHVGVEVEGLAAQPVRERVGACGNGLRPQRLVRPCARHLLRDDALEVGLETEDVDRVELLPRHRDGDLTAVRPVELERRRTGQEEDRACELGRRPVHGDPQLRAESDVAGRERIGLPEDVPHPERDRGANGHAALGLGDENPDAGHRRRAELRAGVVVTEDLVVGPPVLRVAERAVLAHADTVPPAAAADEEGRRRHGRRGGRRGCANACGRGNRERETKTGESEQHPPHGRPDAEAS